jgi:SAM-dependent methyltransferase
MPTNWEERYRTGDTPWDRGGPSPGLVDYLALHELDGRVLVPGCGFGYDVRALATKRNYVLGIDVAPSAIRGARRFLRKACEEYRLADLFALPREFTEAFDWVWEHTCFCAIDPSRRSDYVRATASALKPGGHFLGVFYLDPDHGDGPPYPVTIGELDALFGGVFDYLEGWVPASTYPGREGCELIRLLRKR